MLWWKLLIAHCLVEMANKMRDSFVLKSLVIGRYMAEAVCRLASLGFMWSWKCSKKLCIGAYILGTSTGAYIVRDIWGSLN